MFKTVEYEKGGLQILSSGKMKKLMSTYIKLMWLPQINESLMWFDETSLNLKNVKLQSKLLKELNIIEWHEEYSDLYKRWLENDLEDIYNIYGNVHQRMLKEISVWNLNNKDYKIFYWFDVDRNKEVFENFQWKYCPISNTSLTKLTWAHLNNRFISNSLPLVFPE